MLHLEDYDTEDGEGEGGFSAACAGGAGVVVRVCRAGEGEVVVVGLEEGGDVGACLGHEEVVDVEEFGDAGEW